MASQAFEVWQTEGREALDQLERAHRAVGGTQAGRRYATLHLNHAYLVMVSSHFQRFCRDLHTECVQHLWAHEDPLRRDLLKINLSVHRQLDSRNPSAGTIGADFNRFNLDFWNRVKRRSPTLNERRQRGLEQLNAWRMPLRTRIS